MISWDNLDSLTRQFEACNVSTGTNVVLLTDQHTPSDVVDLVALSIDRLSATLVEVRARTTSIAAAATNPVLEGALRSAELVVTCGPEHGFAQWWDSQDFADQRLLHLSPATVHAGRYRPQQSMRRRTATLSKTFRKASKALLSDPHGTELHIDLAQATVTGSSGTVLDPGTVAVFPGGMVLVHPIERAIDGTLVFMPGDANLRLATFIHSPVRLTFERSHLTRIDGETSDADSIRAVVEQASQFSNTDQSEPLTARELQLGVNAGHTQCVNPFDPLLLDRDQAPIAAGLIGFGFGQIGGEPTGSCDALTFVLPQRSLSIDGLDVITAGELQGAFGPDVYETAG